MAVDVLGDAVDDLYGEQQRPWSAIWDSSPEKEVEDSLAPGGEGRQRWANGHAYSVVAGDASGRDMGVGHAQRQHDLGVASAERAMEPYGEDLLGYLLSLYREHKIAVYLAECGILAIIAHLVGVL